MKQALMTLEIATHGAGLTDITAEVRQAVRASDVTAGLLTLFIQHTSASLLVQENADPAVLADLSDFLALLVPRDPRRYRHNAEGPDDMPAHIRSALTAVTLSIPVRDGVPLLGTWQAIYLFEHRDRGHRRQVLAQIMGE